MFINLFFCFDFFGNSIVKVWRIVIVRFNILLVFFVCCFDLVWIRWFRNFWGILFYKLVILFLFVFSFGVLLRIDLSSVSLMNWDVLFFVLSRVWIFCSEVVGFCCFLVVNGIVLFILFVIVENYKISWERYYDLSFFWWS